MRSAGIPLCASAYCRQISSIKTVYSLGWLGLCASAATLVHTKMTAAKRLQSRAPAVRGIEFNLINAPAIGAAVRPVLLIDRHPDALGKSVRAFPKALDPTSIGLQI